MRPSHKIDLSTQSVKRICPGGSRTLLSPKKAKILKGMGLAVIELQKGGFREPHWHPNAHEITYCEEGKALITVFSPGNLLETFTLEKGEVAYFPKGYIHHIENIFEGKSRFILAYDHDTPEDIDLSASISSMSAKVLSATFGASSSVFEKILKHKRDAFIAQKKGSVNRSSTPSRFKLSLEKVKPQIKTVGGLARMAHKENFPILEKLALFSLRLSKKGIREPHWHPNAIELNYVISGKARLTILSPGGDIDTFELKKNQASLIPAGYFHHIENIGKEELHMAVFFNHPSPSDIGLSGAMSAYDSQVLGALFSVAPTLFASIAKIQKDVMIVSGG